MHINFRKIILTIAVVISALVSMADSVDSTTFSHSDSVYIDLCVNKILERIRANENYLRLGGTTPPDFVIDLREDAIKTKFPLSDLADVTKIVNGINTSNNWKDCINYYVLITNYVYTPGVDISQQDIMAAYMDNPAMFDNLKNGDMPTNQVKKELETLKSTAALAIQDGGKGHQKLLDEINKRVRLSSANEKVILQSLLYEFVSNRLDKCRVYANISFDKTIRKTHRDDFFDEWALIKKSIVSRAHDKAFLPMTQSIKNSLDAYIKKNQTNSEFCNSTLAPITTIPESSFSGQYLSPAGTILFLPPGRHKLIAAVKGGPILAFKVWTDVESNGTMYSSMNTKNFSTGKYSFNGYRNQDGIEYTPEKVGDKSKNVYVVTDFVLQNINTTQIAIPKLTEFKAQSFTSYGTGEIFAKSNGNFRCLFAVENPNQKISATTGTNFTKPIINSYYKLLTYDAYNSVYVVCLKGLTNVAEIDKYFGEFTSNKIKTESVDFGEGATDVYSIVGYSPDDLTSIFSTTTVSPPTSISKLTIGFNSAKYKDGDVIFVPEKLRKSALSFKVEDDLGLYNSYDWWLGVERPATTKIADKSYSTSESWWSSSSAPALKLCRYNNTDFRTVSHLSVRAWDKTLSADGSKNDEVKNIDVVRPDFDITYFNTETFPADNSEYDGFVSNNTKIYTFAGATSYISFKLNTAKIPSADISKYASKLKFDVYAENVSIGSAAFQQFHFSITSQVATNITTAKDVKIRVVLKEKSSGTVLLTDSVYIRYLVPEKLVDLKVQESFEVDDYNEPITNRIGNSGASKGLYVVTCPTPLFSDKYISGPINYNLVTTFDDNDVNTPQNTPADRKFIKVKWSIIEQSYDNSLMSGSASGIETASEQELKNVTGFSIAHNLECDQKRLVALYNPASSPVILKRIVIAEAFGQKIQSEVYFVYYSKTSFEAELNAQGIVNQVKQYSSKVKTVIDNINKMKDLANKLKIVDLKSVTGFLDKVKIEVGMEPIAWDTYNEEIDQSRLYYHTYDPKVAGSATFKCIDAQFPLNLGPFGWATNVISKIGVDVKFYITVNSEIKLIPEFHYKVQNTMPKGPVNTNKSISIGAEGGFDVGVKASVGLKSTYRAFADGRVEPRLVGKVEYNFTDEKWKGGFGFEATKMAFSIGVEEPDTKNPGKYVTVVSFKNSLEILPKFDIF